MFSPVGKWNVSTYMNNEVLNIAGIDNQGNIEAGSWFQWQGITYPITGTWDNSDGVLGFAFQLSIEPILGTGPSTAITVQFEGAAFQGGNPLFNYNVNDGVGPVTANTCNMMAGAWEPDLGGNSEQLYGWAATQVGTVENPGADLQPIATWNLVTNLNNGVLVMKSADTQGDVTGSLVTKPGQLAGVAISGNWDESQSRLEFVSAEATSPISAEVTIYIGYLIQTGNPPLDGPPGEVDPENAAWDLIAGYWERTTIVGGQPTSGQQVGGWVARAPLGTLPVPKPPQQVQPLGLGAWRPHKTPKFRSLEHELKHRLRIRRLIPRHTRTT
jgi:hypothetical protein